MMRDSVERRPNDGNLAAWPGRGRALPGPAPVSRVRAAGRLLQPGRHERLTDGKPSH